MMGGKKRRARVVYFPNKEKPTEQSLEAQRDAWMSSANEERQRRKESREWNERRAANARGERTFVFKTEREAEFERLLVRFGIAKDTSKEAMGNAWSSVVLYLLQNPSLLAPLGQLRDQGNPNLTTWLMGYAKAARDF